MGTVLVVVGSILGAYVLVTLFFVGVAAYFSKVYDEEDRLGVGTRSRSTQEMVKVTLNDDGSVTVDHRRHIEPSYVGYYDGSDELGLPRETVIIEADGVEQTVTKFLEEHRERQKRIDRLTRAASTYADNNLMLAREVRTLEMKVKDLEEQVSGWKEAATDNTRMHNDAKLNLARCKEQLFEVNQELQELKAESLTRAAAVRRARAELNAISLSEDDYLSLPQVT